MTYDVLVVGSGPAGVNAASALVEAGWNVALVDFGNRDTAYAPLIPRERFTSLRRTDPAQHRYLLGDRFEGLPSSKVRVGAQLTPPRQYVHADVASWIPVVSQTFSAMESLATGGLGNAWGAGAFYFSDEELAEAGLDVSVMHRHYERVAARIGISGTRDDLLPFLGDCDSLMPGIRLDSNAERVLARYAAKRRRLQADGFYLGQTRLAVCTQPRSGRGPYGYQDMDFWADFDRSVYRPRWTLEELSRHRNFTYLDRRFVQSFSEAADGLIHLQTRDAESGHVDALQAVALILAAGTLSSTRIVLRSLGCYNTQVPLLCNAYTYVPVLNLHSLGRSARDERCSLAQLTAIYAPRDGGDLVQTQFYSYRSLLTFKLIKETPLASRNALRAMRALMNAIGILGINHADRTAAQKYCLLRAGENDGPDQLHIKYQPTADETALQARHEQTVLRSFRQLGCWPLKRVSPGNGSSIHYAGTLPIDGGDRDLTCDVDCLLRPTRSVYLADGSVFRYLPAKGLTLSIMANADRVGAVVSNRLAAGRRRAAA
jgi:hypothetical protein